MAMRALLLVVFAVAGGVAGWQLRGLAADSAGAVSYTHLRAHET